MSVDTLKVAERLHIAGFTRKQAAEVAGVVAEALADHPRKDAVIESVEALGRTVDRRLAALEAGQAELKVGLAIVNENQLETNRALAAIMAHLGIPKPAE